jgi:hypothetical protein
MVFLVAAALETGRETHLHLRVDAARKRGIGMQVVHAAAHLEEIERIAGKLLCHRTRGKWPVIDVASTETAEPRGDGSPRKLVFEVQFDQRRKAQTEPVTVSFRER